MDRFLAFAGSAGREASPTGEAARRDAGAQGPGRDEIVIGDERFEPLGGEARPPAAAERFIMSRPRRRRLVIKEDELFLYTDADALLIPDEDNSPLGLYCRDTRFLSRWEMEVGRRPPILLSWTADRDYAAATESTNLETRGVDGERIPQAMVHIRRTRLVSDRVYELLRLFNYHDRRVVVELRLTFDADFADMFEVRGARRRRRGTRLAPKATEDTLTLAYYGLDEALRKTVVRFEQPPARIEDTVAVFQMSLELREPTLRARPSIEVLLPDAPLAEADFAGWRDRHEREPAGAAARRGRVRRSRRNPPPGARGLPGRRAAGCV